MRYAWFSVLLLALLFLRPPQPSAQSFHRIGALVADDPFLPVFEGFRAKMAEIGYREGREVSYEFYNGRGDPAALEQMARKLVQSRPQLIVTSSTTATAPVARIGGGAIPVVFLSAGNPLAFVKSYASSGNHLTGISTSTLDLTPKRMELLKELAPRVRSLISLNNPQGPSYEENLRATREGAKKLGLELVEVRVVSGDELVKKGGQILTRKMGDAILHPPDASINAAIRSLTPLINRERLPSIAANVGSVRNGALATYAADYVALGRQGAVIVDKVLRGAHPADIPIEQPMKLHLAVNLKTAKAIGLNIPKEILLRADEAIE